MEREMRQLLAEIALTATGHHLHDEALAIADALEGQEGCEEVTATIRAMSLMNRGKYEEAHALLEPLCQSYPDLICLAALSAGKAGLGSKAESWLAHAEKGSESLQAFSAGFRQDLRAL